MNFSRFFVDRPIFAAVVSIIIFAVGLISIPNLPVSEYPEVVPPSVVVRTVYPGANPKEIAETVATPLEESINGVEDMMYFKSVAGSDGVLQMTITFRPGTDAEDATVRVQNRVSQALARLPEAVRRQGVTTQKQSPTFLMVVHLTSPDGRYDTLYLRNYARLHVKDRLARVQGVGDAQVFGGGDYAMRAWLDPAKVASRGLTASDVVGAMREQNVQVSAGQLGAEPMPDSDFLTLINARGRLRTVQEFGDIVLKSGDDGEIVRLSDVARLELGAGDYTLRAQLDGKDAVAIGIFQAPGANALEIREQVIGIMDELEPRFPEGVEYEAVYDTTIFVSDSIKSVIKTLLEAVLLVVLVVTLFLQTWRASIIPLLAVLAGAAWKLSDGKLWRSAMLLSLVACCVFNYGFSRLDGIGFHVGMMDMAEAKKKTIRRDIRLLNETLPSDARVLMVGEAEVFDAEFAVFYNTVFDESIFEQWTKRDSQAAVAVADGQMKSAAAIRAILREQGISHVFVNWSEILRYRMTYGYTDYVTPARFQQLEEMGILQPPIIMATGDWNGRSKAEQQEALSWPGGDSLRSGPSGWTSMLMYRVVQE